ncbi:hypothetical protein ACKWTF_016451 [Chironomus riparius]
MIGMDVMDENFDSWIKNDFTENLSRPIVVKIYSNSEDIEKKFIVDNNSSNATLQYSMDFLNKVMTTDYFYEDNPEILKDAIKKNCTICIRLAYLIDERFMTNFTITDDEMDALSCDAACFKALLDLPYNFNFNESSDQIYKSIFHSFIDKMRQSLGTAAHISQNYTVGDYLRDFETKFPLFWITALAWKEAEYQIFEFLIRNDFPFPANFLQSRKIEYDNGTKHQYVEHLEKYLIDLGAFHRDILNGNLENVKRFLKRHQHLAFARNLDNKSALKVAFESDQLKIFAYLKSIGMSFAAYKELADYYNSLNSSSQVETKKKQIFQHNRKYFAKVFEVDPVTKILQKSRYIYNHRMYNKNQIVDTLEVAFNEINETFPEIINIIASSIDLELLFDFINTDIADLKFDANCFVGFNSEFNTYIFVSARNLLSKNVTKSNYVLGVIAHELMHSTMEFVYESYAYPYYENDNEKIQVMQNISRTCEEFKDVDPLIRDAFDYYDESEINSELIARVPDMLLTYRHNQTHIEHLKATFEDLFTFYYNFTVPDMKEYMLTMDVREKVRQINDWLNLVDMIKPDEYDYYEDDYDDDVKNVDDNVVEENVKDILDYLKGTKKEKIKIFTILNAKSVLYHLYNQLRKSKLIPIYMPISFSEKGNFQSVMSKIDELNVDIPLVIYCDDNNQIVILSEILLETTFRRIVIVKEANFEDEYEKSFDFDKLNILVVLGFLIIFIILIVISCVLFWRSTKIEAKLLSSLRCYK